MAQSQTPARVIHLIVRKSNMHADAHALSYALSRAYPNDIVRIIELNAKSAPSARADIEVHFEHYMPTEQPAARKFLVVNHEFFYDWDYDAIKAGVVCLVKTRAGEQMCTNILHRICAEMPETRARAPVYVGWTTCFTPPAEPPARDRKLCVHLAGTSPMKNTRLVLEAWLADTPAPNLVGAELFITRQPGVIKQGSEDFAYWKSRRSRLTMFHGIAVQYIETHGRKVYFCQERISDEQLQYFINAATFHLCPSEMEGFGHIVNQGRAAGAVVITFDHPPMNELIDAESGVLIPSTPLRTQGDKFRNLLKYFTPESAALPLASCTSAILLRECDRAFGMSPECVSALGTAARGRYLAEHAHFAGAIASAFAF